MALSKGRVWSRYPICFSLVSEAVECRDLPLGVPCPPMCRCPQSAANAQRRAAEWTDIEKCIFIDKFLQVRSVGDRPRSFSPQRDRDRAAARANSTLSHLLRTCVRSFFAQFPKDFPKISRFLVNRSARDVMRFYYDSKPSVDYKRLMREQTLRRRADVVLPSHWEHSIAAARWAGLTLPDGAPFSFSLFVAPLVASPSFAYRYRTRSPL